jgi:hypothetical protein
MTLRWLAVRKQYVLATLGISGRVSAFAGHFFDMSVTSHRRVEGGIEHRNAHLLCRKNEHLWGSVPCRKSHLLSGNADTWVSGER